VFSEPDQLKKTKSNAALRALTQSFANADNLRGVLSLMKDHRQRTNRSRSYAKITFGTYVIPFLCQWTEGTWQNGKTRRRIEVAVIGWREPKRNQR
jgi:hypothetical protein